MLPRDYLSFSMANWFDYALGWSASAVRFLPQVLQLVQLVEPSLLMFVVWVRWRRCRIVDHFNIDNSFGKLPAKWLLEHAPYAANHDVNLLIENLLLLNLGCRFYGPQPTQGGLPRPRFGHRMQWPVVCVTTTGRLRLADNPTATPTSMSTHKHKHKRNAFDLLSYETVRQQLNHVELIDGAAHAHHLLNLIVVPVLSPSNGYVPSIEH